VISSPALADLRSASLAAQKRLSLAQTTYQREKKLWEDKISAEQDYLQAQTALREAEIEAQTTRSKWRHWVPVKLKVRSTAMSCALHSMA
jgi:cobalt-zinc-cadmium efflux system membrane fusion protein